MGHNPFWSRIQNFKIIFSNIFVHTSATTSYIHSEIFWSDTIIYQGRRKVWKSGFFPAAYLCYASLVNIWYQFSNHPHFDLVFLESQIFSRL